MQNRVPVYHKTSFSLILCVSAWVCVCVGGGGACVRARVRVRVCVCVCVRVRVCVCVFNSRRTCIELAAHIQHKIIFVFISLPEAGNTADN